ncbi:Asp/Glu/hydantoin racemase [Pandoraea terrae]|uniref:Asp/Glu/hydantoin racemase n=1 Tax=Pandoraea terrae TaxID=1537710 RepID=A0A5E4TGI4_9BURK|nr:aspartate/glutamate racemase family protein [Pandoraea terrae]VVD86601.1 Asp/Glu/hydantoin racemase [Pandoraea terrae]
MRLLVVNPNISTSVTALIEAEARRAASPSTELTFATAQFGVAYIETRFEALMGGYATACAAAEHQGNFDGLVVAAFGDPGLGGLKELFDVPVVGMTEAALASACLLGARFSVIAISHRITTWYRECIDANGLSSRLASIRCLTSPLRDIGTVQEDHADRLIELSQLAVEQDGADVIIVAGAPLAGLARSLRDRIPVPVVDGVSSAVRHCESLIALQPGSARAGSCQRPPRKPYAGLPPALGKLLD